MNGGIVAGEWQFDIYSIYGTLLLDNHHVEKTKAHFSSCQAHWDE